MDPSIVWGIAYAAPPIALLGGAVGSTLGTLEAASASLSIIAEEPAQRSRALIFSALPMTQTFYGFIFMYMALMRLASVTEMTLLKALLLLSMSIAVGLAELYSAWTQGKVCRSAVVLLPRTRGAIFSMGIMLAAFEELFGILALAFGLMVLFMVV